jgi:hypothetical protein
MQEYQAHNRGEQTAVNLAEIFLQQSARLIETQAAAASAVIRTQARSFAAFGGPDWSSFYSEENQRQFSELLKTSTEQAVSFIRQTNDTMLQFQDAITRALNRQTDQLTTQMRKSMEEIGARAEQGIDKTRMTAQQAAEAVQQAASGLEGGSRPKRHA